VLVLAMSGCGAGSKPIRPAGGPGYDVLGLPTLADGHVDGVAKEFQRAELRADEELEAAPPGRLEARGCRLRAPGVHVFDLAWEPEGKAAFPLRLPIALGSRVSDVGGTNRSGHVVLTRAGQFSIAVNDYERERPTDEHRGFSVPSLVERDGVCNANAGGQPSTSEVEITVDPLPHAVTAPAGSIQALAQATDLRDERDPGLLLAYLMAERPPLPFDRLWLADGVGARGIGIERTGGCLRLSIDGPNAATPAEHALRITQSTGCPAPAVEKDDRLVPDPKGVWTVVVSGDRRSAAEVDQLVATVRPHPLVGAPEVPKAEASFDGKAYLDSLVAGREEIARLPLGDAVVAVVRSQGMACCEMWDGVVAGGTAPGSGSSTGSTCRRYSSAIHLNAHSYALAVTRDPQLRATLSIPGQPDRAFVLQPAAGGHWAGVLEIPQLPSDVLMNPLWVVVTDAAGKPVPCEQSS
jgi:hypothetical protein